MLSCGYLWLGRGHYLGNGLSHYPTHKALLTIPECLEFITKWRHSISQIIHFDLMQVPSRYPLQMYEGSVGSLGKQTPTSLSLSLIYTTWNKQALVALLCCFLVVKLDGFTSKVGELERSNPGRG